MWVPPPLPMALIQKATTSWKEMGRQTSTVTSFAQELGQHHCLTFKWLFYFFIFFPPNLTSHFFLVSTIIPSQQWILPWDHWFSLSVWRKKRIDCEWYWGKTCSHFKNNSLIFDIACNIASQNRFCLVSQDEGVLSAWRFLIVPFSKHPIHGWTSQGTKLFLLYNNGSADRH